MRQWDMGVALDKLGQALHGRPGPHRGPRPRPEGTRKPGEGLALSGAPRMQRLAWALRGERVVYSLRKPGPLGPAVGHPRVGIAIGITAFAAPSHPSVPQ